MKKKLTYYAFILVLMMSISLALGGCGGKDSGAEVVNGSEVEENLKSDAKQNEIGSEEDAANFIAALDGTYEELWPVAFQSQYDEAWLNSSAASVGEENAQGAVEQLKTVIGGNIYGQEAINAYEKNPESAVYDCYFKNGVDKISVKGKNISGFDA